MTVQQAQHDITSREFVGWKKYFEIDPQGEERADLRMSILAWVLVKLLGKKNANCKPAQFMPKFGPKKRQSAREMFNLLRSVSGNDRNPSG